MQIVNPKGHYDLDRKSCKQIICSAPLHRLDFYPAALSSDHDDYVPLMTAPK